MRSIGSSLKQTLFLNSTTRLTLSCLFDLLMMRGWNVMPLLFSAFFDNELFHLFSRIKKMIVTARGVAIWGNWPWHTEGGRWRPHWSYGSQTQLSTKVNMCWEKDVVIYLFARFVVYYSDNPSCVRRAIMAFTTGFPERVLSIIPSSMHLCNCASNRCLFQGLCVSIFANQRNNYSPLTEAG